MIKQSLKGQFASDNYSGICPQAIQQMVEANDGYDLSYGDDIWTKEACNIFRDIFETDCEVFFVLTGTAANSLALATLCESYHSIICSETAHIETDECGAPEFYSNGAKLLLAKGENGKLDTNEIDKIITKRTDIHYPKPKIISVTQATELGTVYTQSELSEIGAICKQNNMKFHMDGSRFANSLATLKVAPKELTWKSGVDILCLGGTKNGLSIGEAVIFFNKELAEDFAYRCKQAGQLASKMRFVAAQWVGILKDDVWLKNAAHANKCAQLLESYLKEIPDAQIMFPCEANSVFVILPENVVHYLQAKNWHFYSFIGVGGVRFMCSWNTTEEKIKELINDIKSALSLKK